jgi:hypothetical protein
LVLGLFFTFEKLVLEFRTFCKFLVLPFLDFVKPLVVIPGLTALALGYGLPETEIFEANLWVSSS